MSVQKINDRVQITQIDPFSTISYDPLLVLADGTRVAPTQVDVEGPLEYYVESDPVNQDFGDVIFFNPTLEVQNDIEATITYQHSVELDPRQAVQTIAGPGAIDASRFLGCEGWAVPPGAPIPGGAPVIVPYAPVLVTLSAAGVITVDPTTGRFIINETGFYKVRAFLTRSSDAIHTPALLSLVQDPDGAGGGTVNIMEQAGIIPGTADPAGPAPIGLEFAFPVDSLLPAADRTFEIQSLATGAGACITGYAGQATPFAGSLLIERFA